MPETASAVDIGAPELGVARLDDRAVVRVWGADAAHFLQGILTQEVEGLGEGAAAYASLLSAQGKVLFDFLVVRTGDGFLLDTAGGMAADLIKRLTLYRLRAKVQFADVTAEWGVYVAWGDAASNRGAFAGAIAFPDPRVAALGLRILAPAGHAIAASHPAADWHAHRVRLGVPEGGKDFAYGDAFPHEADMDQLAGVSFTKGCYVGQEVVSRMQHRSTARKRIVGVVGEGALAPGAAIMAGEAAIGSVGSVAGRAGLALVRLDRAAEAKAKGIGLQAGGIAISLRKPDWARFDLEPAPAAKDPL